jgi:hypothetical protein
MEVSTNTSDDRTYYYEVFLNNLELALWMESERLMHPIINQIGSTQNRVIKKKTLVTTTIRQNFTHRKGKYV